MVGRRRRIILSRSKKVLLPAKTNPPGTTNRESTQKRGSQGSKARFRARFWSSVEFRQEGRIGCILRYDGKTRRSEELKRRV